ncbi:MAG TPA: hypothetical protein VMB26_12000 [Candidatus Binataceae bacterium]|nr:hypothetical protein [Candidatus Binataceae bacterium]
MRITKKLALIAAGYALAVAGGIAAVGVNEMRIADDIKQSSGGMVAFGDMIVFVLAAGVLSLVPTWFLLKLCLERAPRILLIAELMIAALGPASWLAVAYMVAGSSPQSLPHTFGEILGVFIAFVAIPRMVFGPVMLIIEGATFLLVRARLARTLVAAAMLMELLPMSIYALHFAAAIRR